MKAKKDRAGLPPMERRPVFVMYTAVRRCRYNPSFDRFLELPRAFQADVSERWEHRHRGTFNFSGSDVSRRPTPRKRR